MSNTSPGSPGRPGGAQRRPLPLPPDPLAAPSPHAAVIARLSEQVAAQLEAAVAADQAAQEQAASRPRSTRGTALDGAVEVRLDDKGMLASARFGPEVAGWTPEELRELTLEALQDATAQTGLAHPTAVVGDPLQRRELADTVLSLIEEPRP